jgi:hypothetical protein
MDTARIREIRSLISTEAPDELVLGAQEDFAALAALTGSEAAARAADEPHERVEVGFLRELLTEAEATLTAQAK